MAAPPIAERHLHHFHRRSPIKESVRVATTANITISTALNNGDSLDGVTLATDDRVLVKDQSTGSQNGIYVVGASPARDYDVSTDDPAFGYLVYVREGTANAGTVWANTNTSAPTIGTTALTFASAAGGTGAPTTADYLVGTAQGGLSAEIVVGTTPGGELGGTWASPTVDSTHSGSAHTDFIAKSLLTTQDDIIVRDGTGPARLAKGSDGQVLTVDPTTHHLVWATPTAGSGDVATDTIWDAKGDLAGGTGSNTAARLAVGSNGQVLTADSGETTGMKWATASGGSGALVLLEQHTASSSATLDFTTCLTSTYDEYMIDFVAIMPATNGAVPYLRFSTNGGSSYDSSGIYDYAETHSLMGAGESGVNASNQSAYLMFSDGAGTGLYSSGLPAFEGTLRLYDPLSTTNHKRVTFLGFGVYSATGGVYHIWSGGNYRNTSAVNAFRFLMSSGNIASGTVRCYGIAK